MNKKMLGMFLASSILVSVPMSYAMAEEVAPQPMQAPVQVAVDVEDLTDLPEGHWAYNAVKFLVEELEVMAPKTSNMFKGNELMTRYELAEVFYRVMKKLEAASDVDLMELANAPDTEMTDVSSAYQTVVDSVVNDYGIMQPMPGKKFMGNEPISRYEIAYELYNYFVLLESAGNSPALARRDRSVELKDLPADHWATKAVKEIVDKYQIMDGYPNDTFMGGKRLTRYESAATIREFIRYVDTYLIPLVPTPTPEPTMEPTPEPTPTPEPMPMLPPASMLDINVAGVGQISESSQTGMRFMLPHVYGGQGDLDLWFGRGWFGLGAGGEYMMTDGPLKTNAADTDAATLGYANRWRGNGYLNFRLWGNKTSEGPQVALGLGGDATQFAGSKLVYGPHANLSFDIPFASWVGLTLDGGFSWYNGFTAWNFGDLTKSMRADAFAGLSFPAYGVFKAELGYNAAFYALPDVNAGKMVTEHGPKLNLKLSF